MKLVTYCTVDTTLSSDQCSSIDNWDDYIEYINDIIYSKHVEVRNVYTTNKLGNLGIIIDSDNLFDDKDGKAIIYITIIPTNDDKYNTEDEWYNVFYDELKDNKKFIQFLESLVLEFINNMNEVVKHIVIPKMENLIFKNERFFMEISPLVSSHTPEYIPIQLDSNIDINDFYSNL